MGKTYNSIPANIPAWIAKQKIFFVATSALSVHNETGDIVKNEDWGYSNVSPKDMTGFEVVNENCVRYQDLTGSGVETIAHLRQKGNGKLTIMFVAFEGGPRILRLFGIGKVYERSSPEFNARLPLGDSRIRVGCRAIIELEISKVGTSCGFSIPFFDYVKDRPVLDDWSRKKIKLDLARPLPADVEDDCEDASEEDIFTKLIASGGDILEGGLRDYWNFKNARSRDLLIGMGELAAPVNISSPDGAIKKVQIGGDDLEIKVKADGSAEQVNDPAEEPKTAEALVSEKWGKRIAGNDLDMALLDFQVEENKTYDGATVLRLMRRERLKEEGFNKDHLLLLACVLAVGLAMGVALAEIFVRLGIKSTPICRAG